jgi:glycosyltransferase involved in cell wall biosynthesis
VVKEISDLFLSKMICFAGNASYGAGGQGEFLRQMVSILDQVPQACVYSRYSKAERVECINLPFVGFPRRTLFDTISSVPLARGRRDWMTLLSDLDFDNRLAARVQAADLLDGIMGQCCNAFAKLKRMGTRLVLTCLNTHIDNLIETVEAEHKRVGFKDRHSFHPWMRRRSLQEIELADHIRVNSEWARRTFIERGVPSERVHVIRPPVDHKHFYPVEKEDDVFRVLAVSSIDPRKGIHYLLRAFEEAKIPNSELILIGGTGDRWSRSMLDEFLRRNDNIRILSMDVTVASVTQSYGAASVLVHPALEDGYGLVIPQALSSGRPVIATRQSGASELIQDGRNGFIVESRSVKELKERLHLLASDRDLLEDMSRAAAESVEHLGYSDFAADVLAFYRKVLNDGHISN